MTRLLEDYLRVALDDTRSSARRLAEKPHIRKLGYVDEDGKVRSVRELLLSGDLTGSNLIQTEVYNTVVEGANPMRALFDLLPTVRTKGTIFKWPYGAPGAYAGRYAQGAEIAIDTQDYDAATYDASEVIGVRPLVTDTMVESGQVDVIAEEIKYAGQAVQNTAERRCLTAMLEGSELEYDTAGSNQGLKAITRAVTKVKGNNCYPDAVVLHPDAEGICLQDVVIPQSPGADAIARGQGIPDGYLGLKWRVSSVLQDSQYDWGYSSDGDIGAIVLDSSRAGGIYLPRDLTIKDYDDPVRDLVGMTVTMRMDSQAHIGKAICRVEY